MIVLIRCNERSSHDRSSAVAMAGGDERAERNDADVARAGGGRDESICSVSHGRSDGS
jgi:hypothetical protein